MTAPPVPGVHTIILDPRLLAPNVPLVPLVPLLHVPAGYTIRGMAYPRMTQNGMVEFKVELARTGIDKPLSP